MSPVVSRPLPSAGHSVVVSGYSLPHFGHFFIGRLCLVSCLGELSAYHTVSLVPKALSLETKMRAKHHATPASLITADLQLGLNEHDHEREKHQRLDER